MRRTYRSLAISLALLLGMSSTATPAVAAPGGPPKCWVSWRPSEGSISFTNTGKNETDMTFRLKWRGEDLTFRTCRYHTAFELETFFGTSNNRHKLGSFKILSTDLPNAYIDSAREQGEVTFGTGNADALSPDRWYANLPVQREARHRRVHRRRRLPRIPPEWLSFRSGEVC